MALSKNITSSILLFSFMIFIPYLGHSETKKIDLNNPKNLLQWSGTKPGGGHKGTLKLKSADLKTDAKGSILKGSSFVIDMTSLKVTDIDAEDPNNKKLADHLASDDFFSIKKHPEAKFVITSIIEKKDAAGNTHEINGDLTIKGATHSLKKPFPAKITATQIQANIPVDRVQWGITFKSGSYFVDMAKNLVIHDVFNVKLDLTTTP